MACLRVSLRPTSAAAGSTWHGRPDSSPKPSSAACSRPAEFFYHAIKPWVHYVSSGWNGLEEVDRVVQFLKQNDDMARAIGANSQRFAAERLNTEARMCYIKVCGGGGMWVGVCLCVWGGWGVGGVGGVLGHLFCRRVHAAACLAWLVALAAA